MVALRPFKSSTLEGAFLEAAFLLQQGELNYFLSGDWKVDLDNNATKTPSGEDLPNYINITIDTDQQRCIITATIPVQLKSKPFGGSLVATEFAINEYVYPQ